MVAAARLVALETDMTRVLRGAEAAIEQLNSSGHFALGQVPRAPAQEPGAQLWIDRTDQDLEILLNLDWEAGVAHLDVTAQSSDRVEAVLEAFDAHCMYGDLDEQLDAARGKGGIGERELVRVALAAAQRPGDPAVLDLISAALQDSRPELRRAGAYGVFALGWPELLRELSSAVRREPSADLAEQMRRVLESFSSRTP
jgi:hypothetical protein